MSTGMSAMKHLVLAISWTWRRLGGRGVGHRGLAFRLGRRMRSEKERHAQNDIYGIKIFL
jgi:hypothetical protein